MLSFGARDEHGRRADQIHAPEFLMTGDVLSGNAAGALGERAVVPRYFVVAEFAFGMGEEIGAVAVKSEHQEQFRVHARGANLSALKAGDGESKSLLQLHGIIKGQ